MALRTHQASLPGMEDAYGDSPASLNSSLPPLAPVASAEAAISGPSPGQVVYVVDANHLIFQVFHGIPEMTSPRGMQVSALFGFTRDLLLLLEAKRPDFLFCAFDLPGGTFRDRLYPKYKSGRAEMPDDLIPQFPAIRRMIEALGVPALDAVGFEADDILATIARISDEAGANCVLVTGDKDCRQLIGERVKIYNTRKNQIYDEQALMRDWGVRPDQVVDFQALVGDAVDAVPGVPLIGPKMARELLTRFETLEGIFEHVDEVSGVKRKENLREGRETALLSRELVRLDRRVPLDIDWRLGLAGRIDLPIFAHLCAEFGFHRFPTQAKALATRPPITTLAKSMLGVEESVSATVVKESLATQSLVAPSPSEAPPGEWKTNYRLIDTPDQLAELVERLSRAPAIAVDTETTSISPTQAELVGISLAWEDGEACYLPIRAPAGERKLELAPTIDSLRGILESPRIEKVGQNLKYDMIVLRRAGIRLAGVAFDTMLASYLLDAGERVHNLDELARRYLGHSNIKIDELIGSGARQKRMDEAPVARVAEYAAEDADVAWRLRAPLAARLEKEGSLELFRSVEMPLVETLVEMECQGVRIDPARLAELSVEFGQRLVALEGEIHALAGHPFNIASPKQLAQVLFEEQQLPILERGKTGPSTDSKVLETLAKKHPLPAKIIEYRQFAKLKNTYVDALPTMVHPGTGRVHCSFQQAVAATGRLSCSDPNLQNLPIRSEEGREIRSAIRPGPDGWLLMAADYSQIELRVLAHFSEDENLCRAFADGQDIHSLVAAEVHGVPLAEVTREMRRRAKAVNFGVVYGQSAFGLAQALDIDKGQAAVFIDAYFAKYPGVEAFILKTLADCARQGYVTTILGRRRAIQGVRPDAGRQRNLPERTAINTVIQGSAADLIKLAMLAISKRMTRESFRAKLLLQIHDELLFEAPPEELEALTRLAREEMIAVGTSGPAALRVPLIVDTKSGPNWAFEE